MRVQTKNFFLAGGTWMRCADESLPLTGKPYNKYMRNTPVTLAPRVSACRIFRAIVLELTRNYQRDDHRAAAVLLAYPLASDPAHHLSELMRVSDTFG